MKGFVVQAGYSANSPVFALRNGKQWAADDFELCFHLDPAVALRALRCSRGPKSVSPVEV